MATPTGSNQGRGQKAPGQQSETTGKQPEQPGAREQTRGREQTGKREPTKDTGSSTSSSSGSSAAQRESEYTGAESIPVNVSPAEKAKAISPRLLMNAQFRLENNLRNNVLELSDALESLDVNYKREVINRICAANSVVGEYLNQLFMNPASMQTHAQCQVPMFALNPTQLTLMQAVLQRVIPNVCNFSTVYDHHMTHEELLTTVLAVQGTESARSTFLQVCINCLAIAIGQSAQVQDPSYTGLINLRTDLVRALSFLESDQTAGMRRSIIAHQMNAMQAAKTRFGQEIKTRKKSSEQWPVVDFVHSEGNLDVNVYFGQGYEAKDVGLDISNNGQEIYIWSKGKKPFNRKFALPCPVEPESTDAKFDHGILHVTCKKAAQNIPVS